jgi:hypothetical protein
MAVFSVLDLLLVVIGLMVVIWGLYRQTLGMVITFFGFYVSTIFAGLVMILLARLQVFGMGLVESLGGTGDTAALFQAVAFLALLVGIYVVYHIGTNMLFPAPAIEDLGFLDNLLGGLLGVAMGLVVMAVFANVWRYAVLEGWRPYGLRNAMWFAYDGSFLAPYMRRVLAVYNQLLIPFLFMGYPPVLIPIG